MTKGRKHLLIGAGVVGAGVIGYILYRRHKEGQAEPEPVPQYEYGTPGEAIAGGTGGGGGGGSSVEPIAPGNTAGSETPAATTPAEHVNRNQSPTGPRAGGSNTQRPHPPNQGEPRGAQGEPHGNQGRPPVQGRPPQVHLEPTQGHQGQGHELVTTGEHGGHVVHPRQAQKRSVPVRKR